jgi:hypothetical protein
MSRNEGCLSEGLQGSKALTEKRLMDEKNCVINANGSRRQEVVRDLLDVLGKVLNLNHEDTCVKI